MIKDKRLRSKNHRKFVAKLPCCKCFAPNLSQAAHIDERMNKSMGLKDHDFVIPLCADSSNGQGCHSKRDQHIDIDFWEKNNEKARVLGKRLYEISGDSLAALQLICNWRD